MLTTFHRESFGNKVLTETGKMGGSIPDKSRNNSLQPKLHQFLGP